MVTTIYFVRHCEPNYNNHDDTSRELTEKGLQDCQLILNFFENKVVDSIFSSPYKRAVDTVMPLSIKLGMELKIVDNFRERKVDSVWIEEFTSFTKRQWSDFSYKLSDGESLQEVQTRNISALFTILKDYQGNSVVIGSHGTAISTILNYFNPSFGYEAFNQIKGLMPFIATLTFEKDRCLSMTIDNLFTGETMTL